MENGVREYNSPIGQTTKWNMAWEQVLVMVNGFQMLEYLQKIVIHARDKRRTNIQAQYSYGQASESFYPKLQQ